MQAKLFEIITKKKHEKVIENMKEENKAF